MNDLPELTDVVKMFAIVRYLDAECDDPCVEVIWDSDQTSLWERVDCKTHDRRIRIIDVEYFHYNSGRYVIGA